MENISPSANSSKILTDRLFVNKLSLCLHLLGAKSDLLSTVGSWKDTLEDEEVLHSLDLWIEGTLEEQKQTISHVEQWHKRP